jgi:hypothetical protein
MEPVSNVQPAVPFKIEIDAKNGILTLIRENEVDQQYQVFVDGEKKTFLTDPAQLEVIRQQLIAFSNKEGVEFKHLQGTRLESDGVKTDQAAPKPDEPPLEGTANTSKVASQFFQMSDSEDYVKVVGEIFEKTLPKKSPDEVEAPKGLDGKKVSNETDVNKSKSKNKKTIKKMIKIAKKNLESVGDFYKKVGRAIVKLAKWIWSHTIGGLYEKIRARDNLKNKKEFERNIKRKTTTEEILPIADVEAKRLHEQYFKVKANVIKADPAKGIVVAPWKDIKLAISLAREQFASLLLNEEMTDEQKMQFGRLVETILCGRSVSTTNLFSLQPREKLKDPTPIVEHFKGLNSLLTRYCFNQMGGLNKVKKELDDVQMLTAAIYDSLESFGKDYPRSKHMLAGVEVNDENGSIGSGFQKMLSAYKDSLLAQDTAALQQQLEMLRKSEFYAMFSKTFTGGLLPADWFEEVLGRVKGEFHLLKPALIAGTQVADLHDDTKSSTIDELLKLKALEWMILMSQRSQAPYVKNYLQISDTILPMGGSTVHEVAKGFNTFISRVEGIKIGSQNASIYATANYSLQLESPWDTRSKSYNPKEGWSNLRLCWDIPEEGLQRMETLIIG